MTADPRTTWALDREIVLSRVLAAPRERVFQAWADPNQIAQWFGPDGTRWDNRMVFLRVEAPRLIEMELGYQTPGKLARHLGVS